MKSKQPFYICAFLCFLGAVLALTAMIASTGNTEGDFLLSMLITIADTLTAVFHYAAWSFPVFLLVIAVLMLLTASHRFMWPALLFTILLFCTAVIFIHSVFGSESFWLHTLVSTNGNTQLTGAYVLGLLMVELLIFYFWSRFTFRKSGKLHAYAYKNSSGVLNSNTASITSSERLSESERLPEISAKEQKKIDRKVSSRIQKMKQKRERKRVRRARIEEEKRQEELINSNGESTPPAYRPAEGEHKFGDSDGEDEEIFAIQETDDEINARKEIPAGSDQVDQHGLGNKDLTLSFPLIPDLPELDTIIGKKNQPIQQEIAFEDTSDVDSADDTTTAPSGQEKTTPLIVDDQIPEGSFQTAQPAEITGSNGKILEDDWEQERDPTLIQAVEDSEDVLQNKTMQQEFSSSTITDDEFVPGVIGLASHADEEGGGGSEKKFFSNIRKGNYIPPSEDLLLDYPDISSTIDENTRKSGEILMQTLKEFKIDVELTGVQKGPVVTMFELFPAPGIRVQTITNLADNIALQLAASRVRIVAPIPGKQAVGIEVPNRKRFTVGFKEMLQSIVEHEEYAIPIVLGTDITGEKQIIDLVKTPHLLIAGATGSGKSVCVNSLICSILYRRSPQEVRLMLVDPKIVELKLYNNIPHLLTPVITEPKKALKALQYCLFEMERRYSLLDSLNVRDLGSYNKRIENYKLAREKLPYIVVIIDEFADLMTTTGKELEGYLARLAAMARAVGIHLVLATQRPSTNVITGIIKANIPSRIAFMVTSNTDSRIVIDQPGAEKLLGRGDMLFSSSWDPVPSRIQGAFLAEEEVEKIVAYVKSQGEPDYLDEAYFMDDEEDEDELNNYNDADAEDDLMQEALKIVSQRGSASASYLQRKLKIGYNRAARIVEEMEDRGIVGPAQGSKPRDVLRMPGLD